MVTLALADLPSEGLVTLTVTVTGEMMEVGVKYAPLVEMVPTAVFPPWMLLTDQVSPLELPPWRVAVNCWACPDCKVTDVGEIAIEVAACPMPRAKHRNANVPR